MPSQRCCLLCVVPCRAVLCMRISQMCQAVLWNAADGRCFTSWSKQRAAALLPLPLDCKLCARDLCSRADSAANGVSSARAPPSSRRDTRNVRVCIDTSFNSKCCSLRVSCKVFGNARRSVIRSGALARPWSVTYIRRAGAHLKCNLHHPSVMGTSSPHDTVHIAAQQLAVVTPRTATYHAANVTDTDPRISLQSYPYPLLNFAEAFVSSHLNSCLRMLTSLNHDGLMTRARLPTP